MASVNVLGGDIKSGKWSVIPFSNLEITIGTNEDEQVFNFAGQVYQVEFQTEEKLKNLAGSAGWGFAGAVLLGFFTGGVGTIAGLLGGVLAGGNKTEICFSCELKDGRKFIAVTETKIYQKILALIYEPQIETSRLPDNTNKIPNELSSITVTSSTNPTSDPIVEPPLPEDCPRCNNKLPPPFKSSGRVVCKCGWTNKPKKRPTAI